MSSAFRPLYNPVPYVAASTCGLILSIVPVLLRFWSRIVSEAPVGWDDWTALAALPFAVTVAGMTYAATDGLTQTSIADPMHSGAGINPRLLGFGRRFLSMNICYDFGITFVKLSALFFYQRVFGRGVRSFRIALQVTGALCILWLLVTFILELFMCSLFAPLWVLGGPSSQVKCLNTKALMIGTSSVNVGLDIVILVLPHFLLVKLQMNIWRKLGLIGVFLCAYSVVAMSLYRMLSTALGDAELANRGLTVAYALEIPVAILSVCLPAMVQLGKRCAKSGVRSLFTTDKGSSGGPSHGQGRDIEMHKGFRKIEERSVPS